MRRTCLLAAVLAVAGCGYKVADCDQPTLPFSDDAELTENDVERLIQETDVNTPDQLKCELVCESRYLDANPDGGITAIDSCDLTIDGDFTGDPEGIVGALRCAGRGIPQYCVEN